MRVAHVLVLSLSIAMALPAKADTPHEPERPRRSRQKGTYFLAELSAGGAFGTGFSEAGAGFGVRTTFGFGGAFKGFPPRFYLVGVGRYTGVTATVQQGTQISEIDRDLVDISAGLRVLIPIWRIRLLTEFTLGSSILFSSTNVNHGTETYSTEDSRFAMYFAIGVQYRIQRHLSVGLMAEWAFPTEREATDVVGEMSRVTDSNEMQGWTSVTATVVAHF